MTWGLKRHLVGARILARVPRVVPDQCPGEHGSGTTRGTHDRQRGTAPNLAEHWKTAHILTIAIQLLSLAVTVATFRLAATYFGGVGFGEYALARRAMSIVAFPLLLGLGTSLPRFATRYRPDSGSPGSASYALATLLIAAPVLAIAVATIACLPEPFAKLVFGDARFAWLSRPTLASIVGIYLHTLAFALLIGRFRTVAASVLQLVNAAIAPAFAVVVARGDVARALLWLGAISAITSILAVLASVQGLGARVPLVVLDQCSAWYCEHWSGTTSGTQNSQKRTNLGRSIKDLLAFGIPRVPGEVALFGLFAMPAFVVARRAGVEAAGLLSFGMSLIQLVGSVFAAGAVLLLPITGRMLVEGQTDRVARLVAWSLGLSLAASLALVVAMEATLGPFVRLVLGPELAKGESSARWLLLGSVPYVAYIILRGPLDSLSTWPHAAINLSIALTVEALWLAAGGSPEVGLPASLVVLGVLMAISLRRAFRPFRLCLATAYPLP